MQVRRSAGPAFASRHLSHAAEPHVAPTDAAAVVFRRLASQLAEQRLHVLQEKVYGPAAQREAILAIRADALARAGLDAALPCTYTSGRVDDDVGFGGVQLWGMAPAVGADCRATTVCARGIAGRLVEIHGLRLLALSTVTGARPDGSLPRGVAEQAALMFDNAAALLAEHGFGFGDVVRTWIYCRRILDWYGELNRVRLAFFHAHGITGGDGGAAFPASTGIQGTCAGEECVMDVLAVQSDGGAELAVRPIVGSSRQAPAFAYGSSFSRGMTIDWAGERTVLVSGTASIDAAGATLHCGRGEEQIFETLLNIAALLEDQGASLRDVRTATLFCKDRATLAIYARLVRQLGIVELPVVPVLADVCRPELMVEIEALAVLPRPR